MIIYILGTACVGIGSPRLVLTNYLLVLTKKLARFQFGQMIAFSYRNMQCKHQSWTVHQKRDGGIILTSLSPTATW